MKKIAFLLISLFFASHFLYAQEIKFEHSFEEALKQAKQSDKFIFVDCYTQWCGPCKKMASEVFTQEKVGTYMNGNFVSLKLDMETEEGKKIGSNYKINSYPTFLILDKNEKVIVRWSGSSDADAFLSSVAKCFDINERIETYEKNYKAKKYDAQYLLKYIDKLVNNGEFVQSAALFEEYHNFKNSPRLNTETKKFYTNSNLNNITMPTFTYLMKEKKALGEIIKNSELEGAICSLTSSSLMKTLSEHEYGNSTYNKQFYHDFLKLLNSVEFNESGDMIDFTKLVIFRCENSLDKYLNQLPELLKPISRENKAQIQLVLKVSEKNYTDAQKQKIASIHFN